jgi:hypothetical protein
MPTSSSNENRVKNKVKNWVIIQELPKTDYNFVIRSASIEVNIRKLFTWLRPPFSPFLPRESPLSFRKLIPKELD